MHLKPQDVLVLLKLAVWGEERHWRQEDLARELGIVQSQIHSSLRRSADCGLYDGKSRSVNRVALLGLLLHAMRYLVPGRLGPRARGLPTAYGYRGAFAALAGGLNEPPVWPLPGRPGASESASAGAIVEGVAVEPLHEKAPMAAARDPKLYELLAAVDAMRIGRARDMEMAREILRSRLLAV